MFTFPPTVILRHRKENLKKCSLRGLETRSDCLFFSYPRDALPDLSGYLLLTPDAPPLSEEDRAYGLFLIDGTWRYAEEMCRKAPHFLLKRSIPARYKTAYPRKPNPENGLASVEALFLAYRILGRDISGLLDHYHWKEIFLKLNFHS